MVLRIHWRTCCRYSLPFLHYKCLLIIHVFILSIFQFCLNCHKAHIKINAFEWVVCGSFGGLWIKPLRSPTHSPSTTMGNVEMVVIFHLSGWNGIQTLWRAEEEVVMQSLFEVWFVLFTIAWHKFICWCVLFGGLLTTVFCTLNSRHSENLFRKKN